MFPKKICSWNPVLFFPFINIPQNRQSFLWKTWLKPSIYNNTEVCPDHWAPRQETVSFLHQYIPHQSPISFLCCLLQTSSVLFQLFPLSLLPYHSRYDTLSLLPYHSRYPFQIFHWKHWDHQKWAPSNSCPVFETVSVYFLPPLCLFSWFRGRSVTPLLVSACRYALHLHHEIVTSLFWILILCSAGLLKPTSVPSWILKNPFDKYSVLIEGHCISNLTLTSHP